MTMLSNRIYSQYQRTNGMCLAKNMEMEVESFKDKIKTLDDWVEG